MPSGRAKRTNFTGSQHHSPLTTEERNRLPDRDFSVILKDGTRKYPIEDEAHARNALARVAANGSPEEKAEVRRKVHERYPSIDS